MGDTILLNPSIGNDGRAYYVVTFCNDKEGRRLKRFANAEVRMWKDTQEIWSICFGNGEEIFFTDRPYEEQKRDGNHRVVPLEVLPPLVR